MPTTPDPDERYLQIIEGRLEVCKAYRPKLGKKDAVSLEEFRAIYSGDVFYNWFGLSNPLLYAAHKAAGGLTSLYRQVGLGC